MPPVLPPSSSPPPTGSSTTPTTNARRANLLLLLLPPVSDYVGCCGSPAGTAASSSRWLISSADAQNQRPFARYTDRVAALWRGGTIRRLLIDVGSIGMTNFVPFVPFLDLGDRRFRIQSELPHRGLLGPASCEPDANIIPVSIL